MATTIPKRLLPEFNAFMEANDFDDMPDGAWFATLEHAAQQFINAHCIRKACSNDAVHQYLLSKDQA